MPGRSRTPFVEGLRTSEVIDVPLEDIDSEDTRYQYRLTMTLGDLTKSIRQEGQQEPVDLASPKPYRIVDGFRRVAAIKHLGWRTVKAFVHRNLAEDDAHKLSFLKNVVRRNLTRMDRAHAIFQAKRRGLKAADLAEAFNLSERQLRRYEVLLDFPEDTRRLLDRGKLSMVHAKILTDYGARDVESWAARIKEENLSAKELRRALRQAGVGAKLRASRKLFMKMSKASIRGYPFVITKSAPRVEWERLAKLLREAEEIVSSWE
jgi:ParB/RepB/Spo0J family partition protein